jgi:hypothetical protein
VAGGTIVVNPLVWPEDWFRVTRTDFEEVLNVGPESIWSILWKIQTVTGEAIDFMPERMERL